MRPLSLALAALLAVPTPTQALPRNLPPVDQCKSEPGLAAFRARLNHAVARKDRKAFLAMLSPSVLVNFGGDTGPKAFAETWNLGKPVDRDLWRLLARMLRLGCAHTGDALMIPSMSIQFDSDSAEGLEETFVVVSPGAKLRSGLEPGSRASATLAWDVVKATDQSGDLQTKVRLPDGREGWLFNDELYSPLYYRMVIEKRQGKWMITAFVAGD